MSLLETYRKSIAQGDINCDQEQLQALKHLQRVFDELQQPVSLWQKIMKPKRAVKGLYFYGSVGVGKTYLMDLFFDSLPIERKLRMHFHRFMQEVDANLRRLQGTKDPLDKIASRLAKKVTVLCFDEFFVHDIADAMILGRLFTALFNQGITLITTSNIAPEKLYWNGLHRQRFLPTIELLLIHCDVFGFESKQDYRLRELLNAGVYFCPLDESSHRNLVEFFTLYSHGNGHAGGELWIENRTISCVRQSEHVVWFDFEVICNIPRSQLDFLAIAERFDTVLVSNIPIMSAKDNAKITYFIHLVDVFYDQGVQLIVSAAASPESLYLSGTKTFEFQRTVSRLIEMQSAEYIERATIS